MSLQHDVHDLIAGLDPASARVVAGMIAAQAAPPTEPLAKAYFDFVDHQADALRRGIVRQFIAKRAAGESVDSLVELATTISKIKTGFHSTGDDQFERKHPRGEGGRFKVVNHPIRTDPSADALDDEEEADAGIPHPDRQPGLPAKYKLSPKERARYQQSYEQLAGLVAPYSNMPPGLAEVHTFYSDGTTDRRDLSGDEVLSVRPDKKLRHVEVHVKAPQVPNRDPEAQTFDAVRALTGNPRFAAHVAATNVSDPTQRLLDAWPRTPGDEYSSAAAFRRMRAGADLLTAAAGPFMSPSALMAARTASFVGQYGPQAQQVFGPAVDRAKYRYQGTERKLDEKVTTALAQIKRKNANDPDKAREEMTYGTTDKVQLGNAKMRPGANSKDIEVWKPSPLVEYLHDELPKPRLAALQRMSGHLPPSQGVIIDRQGRVSAQMVGRGDDWYLPFNLRNLGSLQGGEYLRTRTNGGLTTEDVYTGLMAGARSMTVVSHNGLYTMEFDDALRGSRRYSTVAREMTERYGQLLDAVKSGQVPNEDLDPSVFQEIHNQVSQRADVGTPEYDTLFRQAVAAERADPQPSQAMRQEWFDEYLQGQADRFETKDGRAMTVAQAINERVIQPQARAIAANRNLGQPTELGPVYRPTDPEIQEEALRSYEANPEIAVAALGGNISDYRKFMAGRTRDYQARVAPMQLDGPGYGYAMEALKEQFPYFVHRVKYTPWSDTDPRTGGIDQGYVKPRFNRPAGAMVGYFDESITGQGKRTADTVRFQNYGVMSQRQGRNGSYEAQNPRPNVPTPGGDTPSTTGAPRSSTPVSPAQEQQQPAAATSSTSSTSSAPAAAAGGRVRSKAEQADLDYARHVMGQPTFSADTTLTDGDGASLADKQVQPHRDAWMGDPPDGYEDFTALATPMSEVEQMDPAQLAEHVKTLQLLQQRHNLFDLDPKIVGAQARGGEPIQAVPLTDPALVGSALKDNHDTEYDLGWEFAPGRTRTQYGATFDQDEGVRSAAEMAGIKSLMDPDFDDKLTSHQLDLRSHMTDRRSDYPEDELRADATNAVRLRQLHRRYHELPDPAGGGGGAAGGGSRGDYGLAGGGGALPGGPSIATGRGTFMPLGVSTRGSAYSYSVS